MPIFEYTCRGCAHQFEMLVLPTITPACPKCASQELERMISLPALKTESIAGQKGCQKATATISGGSCTSEALSPWSRCSTWSSR